MIRLNARFRKPCFKPIPMLLTAAIAVTMMAAATSSEPDRPFLRTGASAEPVSEAATADRILSLPGVDPLLAAFEQYSGYLTVPPGTRHVFYWLAKSSSPTSSSDPVVLWTNGGPGCSGLLGFGTEHGPFSFGEDGTAKENPYSWNRRANVLYVEQPVGVGFSYGEDEADLVTGDERAAEDNFMVVLAFFEKFPELKGNDFYIASESYGGHYIPQLALALLDKKDELNEAGIMFKGFAVGNPYVEPLSNYVTQFQTDYYHGLIPGPTFHAWQKHCVTTEGLNSNYFYCTLLIMNMAVKTGNINPYAVDYPVCPVDQNRQRSQLSTSLSPLDGAMSSQARQLLQHIRPVAVASPAYQPCAENYLTAYLNRPDVQSAIHVRPDTVEEWSECSFRVSYNHTDVDTSVKGLYERLAVEGVEAGLNMLVYSGDNDSVCSLAGTNEWIYDIGLKVRWGKSWNSWMKDGQTVGYVTTFETKGEGSFRFVTIRGAGHMVPATKPEVALDMFSKFLSNSWH